MAKRCHSNSKPHCMFVRRTNPFINSHKIKFAKLKFVKFAFSFNYSRPGFQYFLGSARMLLVLYVYYAYQSHCVFDLIEFTNWQGFQFQIKTNLYIDWKRQQQQQQQQQIFFACTLYPISMQIFLLASKPKKTKFIDQQMVPVRFKYSSVCKCWFFPFPKVIELCTKKRLVKYAKSCDNKIYLLCPFATHT
jgi:hypothetical protein